jgi:type I restriction enzyme S subunit
MTAYSTIGACCRVGDGTHAKIARQNAGVPYISAKNLKGGQIDQANVMFISENDYNRHFSLDAKALVRPKKGDILFSIIGSLGNQYLYQEGDRFGISSSVAIIRPDQSRIFPEFLFFWVQSVQFQQYVTTIKSGSAQSFLSLEMIRSLPAPAMPLEQQIRVASILSTYEDLIKTNRRRVAVLEEMVRGLFEEWFVRFRFPGHEMVPILDTPEGPLPKNWKSKTLGELTKFKGGNSKLTKSAYRPSGVTAFSASGPDGFVDHAEHAGPAVIVSAVGAYCGKTWFADGEWTMIANTFAVVPTENVSAGFIYLGTLGFEKWPRRGAAQPFIAKSDAVNIRLPIPPTELSVKFERIIAPSLALLRAYSKSNTALTEARDLLLPRLISGQLSVASAERELEVVA